MQRFVTFLKGQNTHLQWWFGVIVLSLSAFLLLGGKMAMESWAFAHLGVLSWPFDAIIEGAGMVALYAWFQAIIGLALGRPPYVPQKGTLVAKDTD